MLGYIKQIETMGIHDGPGIRTIFFFQGCPMRCLYCHNPEMLKFTKENPYTPEQVLEIALKYKHYYGTNGGVTFSGGEPLGQSEFLLECIRLLKQYDIHTTLDTAGSVINGYTKDIIESVDLIIYDVKAVEKDEYESITKFKQKNTLTFLELCQELDKPLWIRHVIVPDINDDLEHIIQLSEYLMPLHHIELIELLPYHTFGISKYKKINITYPLQGTPAMDIIECNKLQEQLNELSQKVST